MYYNYADEIIHVNCFLFSYREGFTVSVRTETERNGDTAGDNHIIDFEIEWKKQRKWEIKAKFER